MDDKDLENLRAAVKKGLTITAFVEGDAGKLFVQWINAEMQRITTELIKQEYDEKPMASVALRAELRAYATIANRMSITQNRGTASKKQLDDSGVHPTGDKTDDLRSPEEIAKDATEQS